jgi:phosphoribosyl 1,2-cyclic phosphodiesterase
MIVRFWGVRGSIPVPGPTTNRYGGNTSCVSVQPEGGPLIIIDAGTGIRRLGKEMMKGEFGHGRGTAHLLISHTHWDHIQGLPFFAPFYVAGNSFFIYARQRDDTHLRAVFNSQTMDPYFPVTFDALKADIAFRELVEGTRFEIDGVKIGCTRLNHPWIAMAYRLDCDGGSVVYVTDTAPFTDILLEHEFIKVAPKPGDPLSDEDRDKLSAMYDGVVGLCKDADVVIYDTQFTQDEYRQRPHWGHSTPDNALEVARAANVKKLVLFHHDPARTDDAQDAITREYQDRAKELGMSTEVLSAFEQMTIQIGAGGAAL